MTLIKKHIICLPVLLLVLAVLTPAHISARSFDFSEELSVSDTVVRFQIPRDNGNPVENDANQSGLYLNDPDNVVSEIVYDPVTGFYTFYRKVGDILLAEPYTMTQDQYFKYMQQKGIKEYWKERRNSAAASGDGTQLIPKIYIGGKVFDKIFGGNTIDIKLQGTADVTFGIKHSRREDPSLSIKQQRQTNFDFDTKIQMSASAKIGTKMSFKLNYNTETQFSFDNKLSLKYEGDEDEIIQLIEAGNVSMPISNSLIKGTQSLFGIKTQLKFGNTTVTAIASYQESETKNIAVNGGNLQNEFDIECLDYEENRHYFLNQYFRSRYEDALSELPMVTSDINITKIEVWITNTTNNYEASRNIVAFTDLGEGREEWIYNDSKVRPKGYGARYPSNGVNTLMDNIDTVQIRSLNTVTSYLTSQGFNSGKDFEKVQKARKLSSSEYTFNSKLGFISLNISVGSNQTLAVAYQYTIIGQDGVFQVGEFSDQGLQDPNVLVTKMLKSTTVDTKMPMWDLMMKNVYNIRAFQVSQNDFVMNILYLGNKNGVATGYFPDAPEEIKGKSLINLMRVDRLNNQQNPVDGGDGVFDFINGASTNGGTINAATGRIYFPVLEPFGSYIREKIFPSNPALAEKYAFDSLYRQTKTIAEQYTSKNKFRMEGRYTSSSGSEINLNAMNVAPGSVKVTAGGVPLTENVDYTVDYTLGRVTILNEALLNSGAGINISLENNTSISTMKKTYLGARVEHQFDPKFIVGGTILHLSERAYTTKVNYSDEPISNTIFGADVNYQTDSQWLTDLVGVLPGVSTKQKSKIAFYGEFARFVQNINKSYGSAGTSYIDDFEGAKSTIDLRQWSFWHLASTPQHQPDLFPEASSSNREYGKNRAKLAWYVIDQSVFYDRYSTLTPANVNNDELSDHRVRQILETEIFPNKDIQAGISTNVAALNLAYYPSERGPYNYDVNNLNDDGSFSNPEDRWGGVMRAIDATDFNATNVEYIEFWMMDPYFEGQDQTNTGRLYFNLGDVSEDILRDGRKSYEHGLPTSSTVTNVDTTIWGRVPRLQAMVNAFDTDPDARKFQDVGYDGLSDEDEQVFFADFINALRDKLNPEAFEKIYNDPSSDDYHHFRGSDYDRDASYGSILKRYRKYNGSEGNSPSETQQPESYTTNNSSLPDMEDINNDNTLSESEAYYQYYIDLDPNKMQQTGQNCITNIFNTSIVTVNGETKRIKWYQFRIPIYNPDKVVGNIEGFSSIRFMRMFMTGFKSDIVIRFATLDLVRGEWRAYQQALQAPGEYVPGDQTGHTTFEMSAVNLEENSSRTPVPYTIPPGIKQEVFTTATSTIRQNEQSMQFSVENLVDGDARAVYKTTSFDFRFYETLRMFIHGEKRFEHEEVSDGDVTVFLRFGSDLTDNYYEYEVPLVMTPWYTSSSDEYAIWPEKNTIAINFDKLVSVKNNRNKAINNGDKQVKTNRIYEENDGQNKMKVLGNPTISEVRSMMIGVRNPKKDGEAAQDKSVIVWVDELRLTELKNDGGWAATGRVEATLADFGRVIASGNYSSSGFGSLDTKVTDSKLESNKNYSVSTDLDLGKVLNQEKVGLVVPVHFDYAKTTVTPEYNPLDPDVKLSTALDQLSSSGKDSLNKAAKDVTKQMSFNVTNLHKNRVGKKTPHVWDVENLTASYAYTSQDVRDSDMEYKVNVTHRGGIGYNYTFNAKPYQPFADKKWASSSYLTIIKDINFYYLPKSFSFNTEMYRQKQEMKMRNKSSGDIIMNESVAKNWDWTRTYDFRYDLTKALSLAYSANSSAYIYEPTGNPDRGTEEYRANRDTIRDELLKFGSISNYNQSTKISYNLPINKLPYLDWLTSTASYTGTYRWIASARSVQVKLGNTAENERSIQINANADLTKLYNKVPYFKKILNPKRSNNENSRTKGKGGGRTSSKVDTITSKEKISTWKWIGNNMVRILLSVKKVSFSYQKNNGVSLPGFMEKPDYLGMNASGMAPGFGFVFGQNNDILNTAIRKGWVTTDTTFNSPYVERMTETYNYKVSLEPFTLLKIDINGNRSYSENFSEYFRSDDFGVFHFYTPTNNGSYSISFMMNGTTFSDGGKLFNNLLNNRQEVAFRLAKDNPNWHGETYYDTIGRNYYPVGYGATSREVLAYSFLSAYSGKGAGSVQLELFRKIALPNWTVNYTGLTKIPAIKKIFKTVSVTHTYKSTYSISSFATNVNYTVAGIIQEGTNNFISKYDINQMLVSEQYVPLIGISLSFNNSLTPSFEYKKSRSVTISFTNNQLTDTEGNEFVIGCGYTIKDIGMIFSSVGGTDIQRSSNDLTLKLDIGFRKDKTTLRSIDESYSQISSGQDKINVYLTGDYNFSQRLTTQVFFKYDVTNPYIASSYKTSNFFAGLTLRFSLSQ